MSAQALVRPQVPAYDWTQYIYHPYRHDQNWIGVLGLGFPLTERIAQVDATTMATTWTLSANPTGRSLVLGKFYNHMKEAVYEIKKLWQIRNCIKSRHIVGLKGWFRLSIPAGICQGVVLGHCNYTLLKWYSEKFNSMKKFLTEYEVWNLLFQLTKALSLLHYGPTPKSRDVPEWQPIFHGHINEYNILVEDAGDGSLPTFKLANFEEHRG
jgi:serine/threonine protein kinase